MKKVHFHIMDRKRGIKVSKMKRNKISLVVFLVISNVLMGCAFGKKEKNYQTNMPEVCEKELRSCFGEDYVLSEGVEKEERFFDEMESVELIKQYTEWALTYQDASNQECIFVFTNACGINQEQEYIEKSIESYFSDLVQQYYRRNFWDKTITQIPGCKEQDSKLYVKPYKLFVLQDVPETSVMFDERIQYSLTENVYFPQLRYDAIFSEFPYTLDLYLYVTYESEKEGERAGQRQDTEIKVREMIEEMIHYTNGSLNATVHITMMDKNGYADGFSMAILHGEYFEDNLGTSYEIALHESFFGPIKRK